MLRFDPAPDMALETSNHLGNLTVRGGRDSRRGNVEEDEVVVVREAHHEPRRTQRGVVEKLADGSGSGFQNRIELLPPVDLLDLRVAHEVEVEHNELAALLEQRARTL